MTSGHYYFVEKLKIVKKNCVNWIALMVKYHMPLRLYLNFKILNISEKEDALPPLGFEPWEKDHSECICSLVG